MIVGGARDLAARVAASVDPENESRPIAILAGSGLTVGAVPGVNAIIRAVRDNLSKDDAADLDQQLRTLPSDGEKYQAAFGFLGLRKPPGIRDRIIRLAAMKAYRNPAMPVDQAYDLKPEALAEYERDVENWELPPGVAALGRIWTGLPRRMRGPIVTTNFDPLCEVAIAKAGGYASARAMDADGSFMSDYRVAENPQVIHVHGYWRESSTLSMASQLNQNRPALNGSLRALLSRYTLLTIGYGAWKDAVTTQLLEIIREQGARELDVLWSFFGDEAALRREIDNNEVLSALSQAPGNVQFYAGVNANEALPQIESAIAPHLEFTSERPRAAAAGAAGLLGWSVVAPTDETQLREKGPRREAALSFFDGRLPNWDDVRNVEIPKRDVTQTIINQLQRALDRRSSTLSILTGASGEGKSTALMQVAVELATKNPSTTVLYNISGRIESVSQILALPEDTSYLLVIDDAFRNCETLRQLVTSINESARTGISIAVASRDTDWSSVGGFAFAWGRYVSTRQYRLKGMSRVDAVALVQAWERLGSEALGELSAEQDSERRVQRLLDAAQDATASDGGTFFGALLATRYGEGLREHVRELLLRLVDRPVHTLSGDSTESLADAFLILALPQSVGVRTMSAPVLAEAVGISEAELIGAVILPLEDEAVLSFNGETLLTRHRSIAAAAVDLAAELELDLTQVAKKVVLAAVRNIDRVGATSNLLPLAYLSQSLSDPVLELAAAKTAAEASPRRISYRTSLSRAYRHSADARSAIAVGEGSASILITALDAATGLRPMLTEWGVAEGYLGRWARNTVLVGLALQDLDRVAPLLGSRTVGPSSTCLCIALRRMWEKHRSYVYLNGLAGIAYLAEGALGGEQSIAQARDFAFRNGAAEPEGAATAAMNLEAGCQAALKELESPLPRSLPTAAFRFNELMELAR